MGDEIESIFTNIEKKAETPREKLHKNLQIGWAAIGIIAFSLSALVSWYTLKKLRK